jgi:hypothetical protein
MTSFSPNSTDVRGCPSAASFFCAHSGPAPQRFAVCAFFPEREQIAEPGTAAEPPIARKRA